MSQMPFSIRNVCSQPMHLFSDMSLKRRLLFFFLPVPVVMLVIVFASTHNHVENTLQDSVAQKTFIQSHAVGYAVSQFLSETRNQIATLAAGSASLEELRMRLRRRMQALIQLGDMRFRETAFVGTGKEAHERYLWVMHDGQVHDIPAEQMDSLSNSPFSIVGMPKENEVQLSQPTEVVYPLDTDERNKPKMRISMQVMRFTTPVILSDGTFAGYLTLSIDLALLQKVIANFSIKTSDASEIPLVLFVDNKGWMIFQMRLDGSLTNMSLDAGRSGMQGDFGRPGFSHAFRPNGNHYGYWQMIRDITANKSGKFFTDERAWNDGPQTADTVSYAPITYMAGNDSGQTVVGGIVLLQPSFAELSQGRELKSIYCFAFVITLVLMLCTVLWVSYSLRRSLLQLKNDMDESSLKSTSTSLPDRVEPEELKELRQSANRILSMLRSLEDDRDKQDSLILARVQLEEAKDMPSNVEYPEDGLIGVSREINQLRQEIQRVAGSQMDVLVTGETGTGKELTSRAIHNLSDRRHGPFITINCGALDEALLMDTLFGHVKGAYTEAKTGRKGAFLTAEGGTLMLDEIGTASPKVQIALLRALSDRCIYPLGSDSKVPFNTRVIAATNADLQEEVAKGNFREDLYFRLAVVTIRTPVLRDRKVDIPYLIMAFLRQAVQESGRLRRIPGISKGALTRLMHYHWPGNVRELRNVVSSALSFCEGDLILPRHLRIGDQKRETADQAEENTQEKEILLPGGVEAEQPSHTNADEKENEMLSGADAADTVREEKKAEAPDTSAAEDSSHTEHAHHAISDRLERILPELRKLGTFSRQEYQDLANVSMRTAQYDLQELVNAGFATKSGKGPSRRYTMQEQ